MENVPEDQPNEFRERYTKKKSFRQAYEEEFNADSARDIVKRKLEMSAQDAVEQLHRLATTAPSDSVRLRASMFIVDKVVTQTGDLSDPLIEQMKKMAKSDPNG